MILTLLNENCGQQCMQNNSFIVVNYKNIAFTQTERDFGKILERNWNLRMIWEIKSFNKTATEA